MPLILIAILILVLLCVKFIGLRAYLYANLLMFTIAWGIATIIMGRVGIAGEQFTISLIVEGVGIAFIALILFLSSIHIPGGEKLHYCWSFTKYGLCLFAKWFVILSIILIPVWYMLLKEPLQRKITENGEVVHVEYMGNGEYRDTNGRWYKEN